MEDPIEADVLAKLLEDVPEELREYILEEIIQEINNLQADQIEVTKLDAASSQRQKLVAALNRKKNEVYGDNLLTIKKSRMS